MADSGSDAANHGSLYRAMVKFFANDNWPYTKVRVESAINVHFVGRNGHWVCYAQTRDDHQQFVFYSVCPIAMPEFKRTSVAKYLTRANYGQIIGNFEWTTGTARCASRPA